MFKIDLMVIEPCFFPAEMIFCMAGMRGRLMHRFHIKTTAGLNLVRLLAKEYRIMDEAVGSLAGVQ